MAIRSFIKKIQIKIGSSFLNINLFYIFKLHLIWFKKDDNKITYKDKP